jgi:tetratricopeptide (TPR) repeat protein
MNINSFHFPSDFPDNILKREIYIDDIPVESMIYRCTSPTEPTSPDIVTFWAGGGILDKQSENTLLDILLGNFRYAIDMAKEREASQLFEKALKNTQDPDRKATLLMGLWQLNQIIDQEKAKKRLGSLKRLMNNMKVAIAENTRNKWLALYRNDTNAFANPYQLRASAMDKLEQGEYDEAEKLYQRMIDLKFELPGTLCHLARIQLLKDEENEAKKTINRAWKLRAKALNYVLPRILFFKIMLAMLENKNPAQWVFELKLALKDESCFMPWTIKPTINHYQASLPDDNFNILMILAEVLQDIQNKYLFDQSIDFK